MNFIFKSAINHRAELETGPSAIKAPEQSLLSPASIVCHGLTSGTGKLLRCVNFAAPGSCRNLNCYQLDGGAASGEQLSPAFICAPLSADSLHPPQVFTPVGCRLRPTKVPFPSVSIFWQGRGHLGGAPPSCPSICRWSPCGLQHAAGRHFLTLLSFH